MLIKDVYKGENVLYQRKHIFYELRIMFQLLVHHLKKISKILDSEPWYVIH